MSMEIIKIAKSINNALLIGIGGGGDIISTIYIRDFLKLFDVKSICGCIVWERIRRDKKPGPTKFEDIENVEVFSDCLGWFDGDEVINGIKPIASSVADFLGEEVLVIDITKGDICISKCLKEFCAENGIDSIFAVDAGGDSIARGNEKNLISPLADSVMLASLYKLKLDYKYKLNKKLNKLNSIPNLILAIVGFGSDCELSRDEIERYLSELSEYVLGVSIVEIDEKLEMFVDNIESEASKIPVITRKGYYGRYKFWGEIEMDIGFLNSLIFYLDLENIYPFTLGRVVENSGNLEEANRKLNQIGIKTELDLEYEIAKERNLL